MLLQMSVSAVAADALSAGDVGAPGVKMSEEPMTIRCVKRTKGRNKLSWDKVKGADGYELWIKYPGKKKYRKAVEKSERVRVVNHSGLKSGSIYSYKVRCYRKAPGRRFYSKFSKALKVTAK